MRASRPLDKIFTQSATARQCSFSLRFPGGNDQHRAEHICDLHQRLNGVQGARLLDGILRWGVDTVFAEQLIATEAAAAVAAGGAAPIEMDGRVASAANAAGLSQEAVEKLVATAEEVGKSGTWSLPLVVDAAGVEAVANGNGYAAGDGGRLLRVDMGAALAGVSARDWQAGEYEEDEVADSGEPSY